MKWVAAARGVRYKEHPSRKHGIKLDRYYSIRYQVHGKSIESGLGWASEKWTLERAISERFRLIEEAKAGEGIKTFRQDQKEKQDAVEKEEQDKKDQEEVQRKKAITINSFFNEIYYPQIQIEKRPKTHEREESIFRIWIDKNIGGLTFWRANRSDIESVFYDILDSGRSVRTAEYAVTTIKQIWREAREKGYAPEIPVISKVVRKRISQNNNARIRFLSRPEAAKLLAAIKEESIPLYEKTLISLHCGLRASEIFNLRWSHVDLEHEILNIIDSKGADRSVNMTKDVLDLMKAKTTGKLNDLVFPGRQGKPSGQISQKFREIANKLFNKDVTDRRERVTFHTCRHTCASWLVKQGISLYLVQKVLGHSTIQVTERYAHLAPDQLQLAASAIDRAVAEHKNKKIVPMRKKA